MKRTKIYLLYSGSFGDNGEVYSFFKYKKDALACIKESEGFFKDKERKEPFYENFEEGVWFRIDEDYILGD